MNKPFAEKVRPETLKEFIGQQHIIGESGTIKKFIDAGHIQSMIFWGPPGTGKTTLAILISKLLNITYLAISATDSGAKELKEIAQKSISIGKLLLFIDEIHRFNKLQQDILLPHIEKGNLVIIGSTTENPSFSVNKAILSRTLVFHFKPLNTEDLEKLLKNATSKLSVNISEKTLKKIAYHSGGDGRKALNLLEAIYFAGEDGFDFLKSNPVYDRNSEEHYNHASALQKSIRGSDENGAIYWLAKMIEAGEPPEFIARRLMIIAAEDIGNAEPLASILASSVFQTVKNIGMPEGRIPLAQLTLFLAKCEKSNEAIHAIDSAIADIRSGKSYSVPNHLKDSHYSSAKEIGEVEGYIYTHSNPFSKQTFLPDKLIEKKYAKESELDSLDKEVENKIVNALKNLNTNTLDFQKLSKLTGYEVWKLKKALRFLVKNKKLKVDKYLNFIIKD